MSPPAKGWSRVRAISTAISFPCRSLLRQFSSFPVSISVPVSVPGAGWAAEGLKRRIKQTISKQDRVLKETNAICMFLPGKWAQTTLKRRSNDAQTTLATSLSNVMLNGCNNMRCTMFEIFSDRPNPFQGVCSALFVVGQKCLAGVHVVATIERRLSGVWASFERRLSLFTM